MYSSSYYRYSNNGLSGGQIIISLLFLVFAIVCQWRVFTKAGESGWKCLIPIYGAYILWKIAWEGEKFWLVFLGSIGVYIASLLFSMLGQAGAVLSLLLSIAYLIFVVVMAVKMNIRLAHRFGKSSTFGVVGLMLFNIIGYAILAFGDADYDENRDYGDGILRNDVEIEKHQSSNSDYWDRLKNS